MKRLLTILFVAICLTSFGQTTGSYWRVSKWTTPFGQALPDSVRIQVKDSVKEYMISHVGGVTATQTMAYADAQGWVVRFPKNLWGYNITSNETDPFYRGDTSNIAYVNQANTFTKDQIINGNITATRHLGQRYAFDNGLQTYMQLSPIGIRHRVYDQDSVNYNETYLSRTHDWYLTLGHPGIQLQWGMEITPIDTNFCLHAITTSSKVGIKLGNDGANIKALENVYTRSLSLYNLTSASSIDTILIIGSGDVAKTPKINLFKGLTLPTVSTPDSALFIEAGEVKRGSVATGVLSLDTSLIAFTNQQNTFIKPQIVSSKLNILDSLNVGKRIFAKNISTVASLDSVVRYRKSTGEFVASPDHFTLADGVLTTADGILSTTSLSVGVGANYVLIDAQNSLRMAGTSTVWKDLIGPFNSGLSGGSAYPAFTADSNYYTFTVDSTGPSICKQYFDIQLNHDYKEYSDIYPHVHFVYTTGQGTPTFIIKYRWANTGQKPGAYTWKRLELSTGTTDGTVQMNYSATGISGAGHTISSILDMQVYLYSTTGVTKTCFGKSYDVHYMLDALGSNDETSKN